MTELTAIEREARDFLIERAKNADEKSPRQAVLTYAELCLAVDPRGTTWKKPRYQGIRSALKNISAEEIQHGRPMIGALVVRPEDRIPDEDFATLVRELGIKMPAGAEQAFWGQQVEQCIRHWAKAGQPAGPGHRGHGHGQDDPAGALMDLNKAMPLVRDARDKVHGMPIYDEVNTALTDINNAISYLSKMAGKPRQAADDAHQPAAPAKRKRQETGREPMARR
jgi:hypothetical protein